MILYDFYFVVVFVNFSINENVLIYFNFLGIIINVFEVLKKKV